MHNEAWDGAAGESSSWPRFWNDNVSISISELLHLLEKKNIASFGNNFFYKVMTDTKYRCSAICIATPFVVKSHVIILND